VQQQTISIDRATNRATVVSQDGVPQTPAEVRGVRVKIQALNDELQTAAERRNSVASRLREMDVDARPGYIERLAALDKRILTIENELTQAAAQLAAAPASALATANVAEQGTPEEVAGRVASQVAGDLVPIIAILSVFVFAPLAITISRYIWKRSMPRERSTPAAVDVGTQQRLDQLQQCVDTIAIEVERISENQRYVTRLLSERSVGAGAAEAVPVNKREAAHSDRI
jgi:hypothetical protein